MKIIHDGYRYDTADECMGCPLGCPDCSVRARGAFVCEECGEEVDLSKRAPIEVVDICIPCAKEDQTAPIPVRIDGVSYPSLKEARK